MILFPNLPKMSKWKRRAAMVVTLPLVWAEVNINFVADVYRCWNAERYIGR